MKGDDYPFPHQGDMFFNRKTNLEIIPTVSTIPLPIELKSIKSHRVSDFSLKRNSRLFQQSQQYEVLLFKFFRVSYYLGITPYYVNQDVSDDGRKKFVTEASGKSHTAFVLFVHVCTAFRCVMLFTLLTYDLKNPLNYFEIARTILSAVLCWFFIWSLWLKHSIWKQILARLANLNYFSNVTVFKLTWLENTIIATFIILLYATSVYPAIEECNQCLEHFYHDHDPKIHESHTKIGTKVSYSNVQIFDQATANWIGKFAFIACNFFGHTTRRYPRMKLLVISLTLWQVCKSFGKWIKERCRKNNRNGIKFTAYETEEILDAYETLREVSNLFRKLVGEMLVTEIVEDILYFSLEVQLRLKDSDWFSIFVVFETGLVAFMAYFVGACAADPIHEMNKWLSRDDVLSQLSPGKVSTLHWQLASNPIGLKGGNLFTVTKSFLANVVTVWLTYFIILLQFQTTLTT